MLKWMIFLAVLTLVLWVLSGPLEAMLDIKSRPRKDMYWCSRHGAFREEHCLRFMDTAMCPRCYKEAWDKAE
jgi:hypothetical protein